MDVNTLGQTFTVLTLSAISMLCACGGSSVGNSADTDLDGVADTIDNCPISANVDQADFDMDGSGDVCDEDDDGDGTVDISDIDKDNDGLIEISTLEELDWMRNNLAGEYLEDHEGNRMMDGCLNIVCVGYELVADLDFDTSGDGVMDANDTYFDYDNDAEGNGWLPIGEYGSRFVANFEGNNRSIYNLYINRLNTDVETDGNYIGFFGYVDGLSSPIEIRNITLSGELMTVTGKTFVAGLVGVADENVTISGSSVIGDVSGETETGGLVGYATRGVTITESRSNGGVTGDTFTGGLVGGVALNVAISNSSSNCDVMGVDFTGGLVGIASTNITIEGSSASGDVTGSKDYTAGLLGRAFNNVTISDSSASGNVTGGEDDTGGLLGYASNSVTISNGSSRGNVTGDVNVGGLVGHMAFLVNISMSTSSSDVVGSDVTGGLVGRAVDAVDINGSSASGEVTGSLFTGGLAGIAGDLATISDSSASGGVIGAGEYTGGLLGNGFGSISVANSFALGEVAGGDYTGGLVGYIDGYESAGGYATSVITNSFVTGIVASGNQYVGGLVGAAEGDTTISNSFTANTVDGVSDVGAVVGFSNSVVHTDNYFADDQGLDALGTNQSTMGDVNPAGISGGALTVLQFATSAGDRGMFTNWGVEWDFGTDSQLPGLVIDGVVYRDGDADGVLD